MRQFDIGMIVIACIAVTIITVAILAAPLRQLLVTKKAKNDNHMNNSNNSLGNQIPLKSAGYACTF